MRAEKPMDTEVEVKFLHVSIEDIRQKLQQLGAQCSHRMRPMRRVIINTPNMRENHGYVRLRDEGDKVTLTYKQFDGSDVDSAKEIEVIVDSFDKALAILKSAGSQVSSYQESRRETWHHDGVEVVIDEWPWIDPYIEIEGGSEQDLRRVAEELGFDWDSEAVFGSATVAYQHQFPDARLDDISVFERICFDDPKPTVLRAM